MESENPDLDDQELHSFLTDLYAQYGYDFRGYAEASLRRRLRQLTRQAGLGSLAQLRRVVLDDAAAFQRLLDALTIHVSEMFRDPPFYAAFRAHVVPYIRTFPTLKLWVAGCASGEEPYSLAILLQEAGLYERTRLYATDLSPAALARARAGIYPAEQLKAYAQNYQLAGGRESLTHYFTVAHGHAAISRSIARHIHFAEHNLVSDEVFGEMNVISCRNVLIYFDRPQQEASVGLMRRSLIRGGFLCLGTQESLRLTRHADAFEEIAPGSRIFRKRIVAAESG